MVSRRPARIAVVLAALALCAVWTVAAGHGHGVGIDGIDGIDDNERCSSCVLAHAAADLGAACASVAAATVAMPADVVDVDTIRGRLVLAVEHDRGPPA